MKTLGAILILLALGIGIVPQFTDCLSQGRAITLSSGSTVPMKCHWTGQAEIAMAVPLLAVGILMIANRHRQTLRMLSILGIVLGVSAILLPTYLIGVCASDEMICNMVMKPSLLFASILIVAVNLAALLRLRISEPGTGSEEFAEPAT